VVKTTDGGLLKYLEYHSPSAPLSQFVIQLLFLLIISILWFKASCFLRKMHLNDKVLWVSPEILGRVVSTVFVINDSCVRPYISEQEWNM
jgi:hypothetical protein